MKRAFVLSGGASLGAVQAGMLKALFDRPEPIAPDLIVGASVGAINGSFIASRPATVDTAEELADIWRGLSRGDIFPVSPIKSFLGITGLGNSLVGDSNLRKIVGGQVEFDRLEDSPISLHVIAADATDGREVRLSEGPAVDAIMASAAIPGVYPPVEIDGITLIDGGVSNNTPISHAVALGADVVYVLPSGYPCSRKEPPSGPLAMALHATTLITQQRLVREIELLRDRVRLVVLPPPCPMDIAPIDFSQGPELVERGQMEAEAFLEAHMRGEEGIPTEISLRRLGPHDHYIPAEDGD